MLDARIGFGFWEPLITHHGRLLAFAYDELGNIGNAGEQRAQRLVVVVLPEPRRC